MRRHLKCKFEKIYNGAIPFLVVVLILSACNGKYNPRADKPSIEQVDSFELIKISQDNTDVEREQGAYTYIIEPESMVYPLVKADSITSPSGGDQTSTTEMPIVEIIEESSKADVRINRPPLFGKTCLEAKYPVKCSSDNVANFIREHLEFPKEAMTATTKGSEMISFYVNKNGIVEDIQVSSKHSVCKECQSAAYSVIEAMPDQWSPALEDSKPVRAKVTIPIEFKTLD